VDGCSYLIAFGEIPVDDEVMDAADLRLIALMEILSRAVDVAAATRRGIPVTALPNLDPITTSTAELTMALVLALARRLPDAIRVVHDGEWRTYQGMGVMGRLLHGATIGIVGFGNVGRKVAGRARAFGMSVLYTDRARFEAATEDEVGARWRELDDLFREADVVCLCTTLTESSRGLVDARRLALMKPTALLVNTSRGPVVEEPALVDALRAGRLAGAALDVFATEPPSPGGGPHPGLLELPNVILTPHIGTATVETRTEQARTAAAGIVAAIEGRRPDHVINPEVYGEAAMPRSDRIG
jgi:phosphoglycerate dehydrogenase-like enzyme